MESAGLMLLYHFMVQTNTGDWAEKRSAQGPSANLEAIDPALVNWNSYELDGITVAMTNYYNSATVFLAVRLY